MPSLPPYSTFRTDAKQMMYPQATSHGNVLTFTPPGFKQALNVKFPDSRLAVCEKCKKNFKTRDLCRVRNCHTSAPWTTAYICVTIDDSCLDEEGKYVDKPLTVRMVQWQPFITKKEFDPKAPVCAACKRTNRTRTFCRDRNKHRHLPWCTVYVLLTALDQTDPDTIVAAPSQRVDSDGEGDSVADDSKTNSRDETSVAGSATIGSDADPESDDINDIAESKTFLVKVSVQGTSIHWLDLAEFEPPASNDGGYGAQGLQEIAPHMYPHAPIDPQMPYYAHGMDYAAAQHQNVLKSHQQYFFQMQQRHHQYLAPAPWPYAIPVDQDPGKDLTAAGKGTPSSKRDTSHEDAFHTLHYQQQQQWAMYYGHGPYAPADPAALTNHGDEIADENTDHQTAGAHGDSEETADAKRQRLA